MDWKRTVVFQPREFDFMKQHWAPVKKLAAGVLAKCGAEVERVRKVREDDVFSVVCGDGGEFTVRWRRVDVRVKKYAMAATVVTRVRVDGSRLARNAFGIVAEHLSDVEEAYVIEFDGDRCGDRCGAQYAAAWGGWGQGVTYAAALLAAWSES